MFSQDLTTLDLGDALVLRGDREVGGRQGMSDPTGKIPVMTPAELLAFEALWPHHNPGKTHAIRHNLGITETRYYVLLHRAANSPDGIRADPITARRVRERAERRAEQRARRIA